ncbi:hypothetical protein KKP88_00985 [Methanothermococcus sp. SCGC AD-155-K20]|nr:hypothetical protein [Methanothermococcus sp. SCGC AD-155-K20]
MYRLILLLEGIMFINIPYKNYILIGILLSYILSYFKKFWGFMVYLITLLWLSNLIIIKNIFSLDIFYVIVYALFPSILYLEALFKRDVMWDIRLLGVFLIPLLVYLLLTILNIEKSDIILTLTYMPLLIYGTYLNFKEDIPNINKNLLIKIAMGVLIPLGIIYLLYINFPDILSYPRSQISIILGFVGLFILLYKVKNINH